MKRGRLLRFVGFSAAVAGASSVVATSSDAAKFRRPFSASVGVNYGFDNNGGGGCTDFACGGVCYDGHSGTDFPLGMGTAIVAPAAGRVTATYEGCSDWGGLGNTCGGRCGNYVQLDHQDGSVTLFCHMQNGSVAVSTGQWVSCGQFIGRSASSGNSSGPHLHFGLRVNGARRDPFAGSCSQSTSYWVGQGSYPHNIPSASCETVCACNPGETQQSSCGNCGTRSRTCNASCQWGSWSSCTGQGPCAPGAVEERACCDCGTQRRTCSSQCAWGAYTPCSGPDPAGGAEACDTGEPGPCAAGTVRCVEGCLTCARNYDPLPETCDGTDNDCSGEVDDGSPTEMGDPPPALAARLIDAAYPGSVFAGDSAEAWVVFRNEGTSAWEPGRLWLEATSTWDQRSSDLYDMDRWPAYGVAAVLPVRVEPGEDVMLDLALRPREGVVGKVRETFHLVDRDGTALKCPAVRFDAEVHVREAPAEVQQDEEGPPVLDRAGDSEEGCACSTPGGRMPGPGLSWLLLAGCSALLRRRGRR